MRLRSAKVPDQDGIRLLLDPVRDRFPRLWHLWVDAGYQGRGKRWAEEALGVSVEVVRKPLKRRSPRRWPRPGHGSGPRRARGVDCKRLMAPRVFRVLPRRWVVERTLAWICHNRRMAKDYERLCATGEAFVYAAMARLMVVRRLARA